MVEQDRYRRIENNLGYEYIIVRKLLYIHAG